MSDKIPELKGKRITIMGLGLNQGGLGVTRFLAKKGAKILVTDLKSPAELESSLKQLSNFQIEYILGQHREEDFIHTDMVIQNPAVPHHSKYLKIARQNGIPIETDLGLFLKFCPSQKIIAIGGTKGKSTVTQLIYNIFKEAKEDTVLAGNIGISVLDTLEKIKPHTRVILEISTWQMEGLRNYSFIPQTVVLTNIFPDHLDRYPNFKKYTQAEKLIFKNLLSNNHLVTNFDYSETQSCKNETIAQIYWFSKEKEVTPGSYVRGEDLVFHFGKDQIVFATRSDLSLPGIHNIENILAASTVGFIHHLSPEIIRKAIKKFSGIPHRLELVREWNKVKFYNDTCATTPQATISALQSFPQQNIVLILGGKDKGLDYEELVKFISQNKQIKKIILLQNPAYDASEKILFLANKYFSSSKIFLTSQLQEGLEVALHYAQAGDLIILSPAAASFGMFKNEFDRGEQFINIVKSL